MGTSSRREQTNRTRVACGLVVLLGAAASGGVLAALLGPEPATGPGFVLGVAYLAALVLYLAWTGPALSSLPELGVSIFPRLGFWAMLAGIAGAVGLFFLLGLALHPGATPVAISALTALGIAVAWRDTVSLPLAVVGLAAGVACGLGTLILGPGDLLTALLYGLTVPPLFVGGCLLLDECGLSHVRVVEGRVLQGVRSFIWGCVAAGPPALLNLMGGAASSGTAVDHWWEPLFAFVPGLAEEVWARLFLVTLFYILLRPRSASRPRRAVAAAILLAALTHSLAHYPDLDLPSAVLTALLYGVPMGMLFVRRDLERAIGYHVFIDLVRFVGALLS